MLMYVENAQGENGNFAMKSEVIRTWQYHGYEVELKKYSHYYEKGGKHEDYAIFMNLYEDWGFTKWLENTYCLGICFDMIKAWEIIKELELEVTSSDFQYLESLSTFQDLVKYEVGGFAELEGIDTKTGDLWLFLPIDNHHIEAWKKLYIGEGRYEGSFQYIETINWWNMTPLERKKALGWSY